MIYKIMGTYQGVEEEIDEFESREEAAQMLSEYRLAFGSGWSLRIWKTWP